MILMFIIFTACNSRISLLFNNIEPNDVENRIKYCYRWSYLHICAIMQITMSTTKTYQFEKLNYRSEDRSNVSMPLATAFFGFVSFQRSQRCGWNPLLQLLDLLYPGRLRQRVSFRSACNDRATVVVGHPVHTSLSLSLSLWTALLAKEVIICKKRKRSAG